MKSRKLQFLTFEAVEVTFKVLLWMIGLWSVGTLIEYFAITFLSEDSFIFEWKMKALGVVLSTIFVSFLFIGYVAISKLEYVKTVCKQRGITGEEFFAQGADALQEEWLKIVGARRGG